MDPMIYIFSNIDIQDRNIVGEYNLYANTYIPSIAMNYFLNATVVPQNTNLIQFANMFAQTLKLQGNNGLCLKINAQMTSPSTTTVGCIIRFNDMVSQLAPEIASIFNVVAMKLLEANNNYQTGDILFDSCRAYLSDVNIPEDLEMSYSIQGETRDVTLASFLRALGQKTFQQLTLFNVATTMSTHPDNTVLLSLRNNYVSNYLVKYLELAVYSLTKRELNVPEERSYISQFAHGKYAEEFYEKHPEGYVVLKPGYTIERHLVAPVTNLSVGPNGNKHLILYYMVRMNGTNVLRSVLVF